MCSKVSINLITTDLIKIDVFLVHYTSSILYNHLYAEMSNLSKQNCKSCKMSNAIVVFLITPELDSCSGKITRLHIDDCLPLIDEPNECTCRYCDLHHDYSTNYRRAELNLVLINCVLE